MSETILYYPHIELPTASAWIRRALLYWDKVGSIVPPVYDFAGGMKEQVSADHRFLMDEGLFIPVDPSPLLYHQQTAEPFIEELEWSVNARMQYSRQRDEGEGTDPLTSNYVPIYREKTSDAVLQRLQEGNLVRRSTDPNLLLFRKDIAAIYMSLLAKHVAAMPQNNMIPATNKSEQIRLAFNNWRTRGELEEVRSLTFTDLIPIPSPDTSIEEILRFKRAHSNELLAFRHEKARLERRIAELANPNAIHDELASIKREVELAIGNLQSAFKSNRIQTRNRTLAAFVKPFSPRLVGSAFTAGAAAHLTNLATVPLAVSAAVGTALVQGAIEVHQHRQKMEREREGLVRGSPYAYLFLAKGRFATRKRP